MGDEDVDEGMNLKARAKYYSEINKEKEDKLNRLINESESHVNMKNEEILHLESEIAMI